jgi:hypothetical protein
MDLWYLYNDRIREGIKIFESDIDEKEYKNNLERLIELYLEELDN